MLYVEGLRIDAYRSTGNVKGLKLLLDDYEFWSRAAPMEYREAWKLTMEYCRNKLKELGQ